MANHPIDQFIHACTDKNLFLGLEAIYTDSNISYESLQRKNSFDHFILNFADSLVFGSCSEAFKTCEYLISILPKAHDQTYTPFKKSLEEMLPYIKSFSHSRSQVEGFLRFKNLSTEGKAIMSYLIHDFESSTLNSDEQEAIIQMVHPNKRPYLLKQIHYRQNINLFKKQKKSLAQVLSIQQKPFLPLNYPKKVNLEQQILSQIDQSEGIPVLFMEPLSIDWKQMTKKLAGQQAIFIFHHLPSLLQCLQFPEILQSLIDRTHLTLILSNYPNAQLSAQAVSGSFKGKLSPILISKLPTFEIYQGLITHVLSECLQQSYQQKQEETPSANWLYTIGKNILFNQLSQKLGPSRYFTLHHAYSNDRWFDPYQGKAPKHADLGPMLPDFMEHVLSRLRKFQVFRKIHPKTKSPRKLAHITGQIVDGGHAPSLNLNSLLKHHDPEKFTPEVLVTEYAVHRSGEYPYIPFMSTVTQERAPNFLKELKKNNTPIKIASTHTGFQETAEKISEHLKAAKTEIAIFHGPDMLNLAIANLTDVPYKIFIDYGLTPQHKAFDLVVVSAEETFLKHKERLKTLDCEICTIPMSIDVREQWPNKAYPKTAFGIPQNSQILTSISNHLDTRLSPDMRYCISEILKRNPQAYYMPIGECQRVETFMQEFEKNGIADRVRFLGALECPSHYARSMDIYLNEFPFGSGFAIRDALAAACPIVSMYDKEGPIQGRLGGIYYSLDKVIHSCNPKDYIQLACDLLQQKTKYIEWSKFSEQCYKEQVHPKQYVQALENHLLSHIMPKQIPMKKT